MSLRLNFENRRRGNLVAAAAVLWASPPLVGLWPTWAEVQAFVKDKSPDAYGKLVDRLLASKHYGERMAVYWLGMVRYANTIGYHSDNHETKPLYRDYVINVFNDNLPFDRFTREQIAGDSQMSKAIDGG